jgi:hypothetical protein
MIQDFFGLFALNCLSTWRKLWLRQMQGACSDNANALQGNCTSDPSPVDLGLSGPGELVTRTSQQCLLVTDVRFLRVEQYLWLDNLYIHNRRTHRSREFSLVDCLGSVCNLWLTSSTLQDGNHSSRQRTYDNRAVAVVGGQLYAQGVNLRFPCQQLGFARFKSIRSNREAEKLYTDSGGKV